MVHSSPLARVTPVESTTFPAMVNMTRVNMVVTWFKDHEICKLGHI